MNKQQLIDIVNAGYEVEFESGSRIIYILSDEECIICNSIAKYTTPILIDEFLEKNTFKSIKPRPLIELSDENKALLESFNNK